MTLQHSTEIEEYQPFSRFSPWKEQKIRYARNYARLLGTEGLRFVGISGSVSYEPEANDDVDLFIITENRRLWSIVLKAMIVRRLTGMHDICLSLFMEQRYAERYYDSTKDRLAIRDSQHVIPIYGGDYYEGMLREHGIKVGENSPRCVDAIVGTKRIPGGSVLSILLFAPVAAFLMLKGLYCNSKLRRIGGLRNAFSTVVRVDRFYLDSEKYHRMRMSYVEED